MSNHDDDRPEDDGLYRSAAIRRKRQRRKQYAVGAVGLAAVLGAGAYVVTAQVIDHRDHTVTDTGALAPVGPPTDPPSSEPPTVAPSPSAPVVTTKSAVKQSVSPAPTPSASLSPGLAARRLTAAGTEPAAVSERSEKVPNGSVRIITARFDLTGRRELLWAADGGKPAGNARCTQNVRFAEGTQPTVQPNLLLCWQTSPSKSVLTILVDRTGHPSVATSAKIIEREWAAMG
jgi:hypothetical protein